MKELENYNLPEDFLLKKEEEFLQTCKLLLCAYSDYIREHESQIYLRSPSGKLRDASNVIYKRRLIKLRLLNFYQPVAQISFHGSKNHRDSLKIYFDLTSEDLKIEIPYYFLSYQNGFHGIIIDYLVRVYSLDTKEKVEDFINVFSAKTLELN